MKTTFFTIAFLLMSFLSIAQSEFNFAGIGFSYIDVTNSSYDMASILKNGPNGKSTMWSDGFNHFEIDMDSKTFIHRYVGDNEGVKEINKITNVVKTKDYIKFNVKSKDLGDVVCMISLNGNSKYKFIIKYEYENNLEIALY